MRERSESVTPETEAAARAAATLLDCPRAEEARQPLALALALAMPAAAVAWRPTTVLIIDDDLFVCRAVACILHEARPVVVHAARDGEEALQVARTALPDLIFLDLKLPGMPAIEICRALRQMPELQFAPICVLTGLLPDPAVLRELKPFVDEMLTKPPDPRKLVALVDEWGGNGAR